MEVFSKTSNQKEEVITKKAEKNFRQFFCPEGRINKSLQSIIMTYVYRKYENPATKQMVDLQDLINNLFEVNKNLKEIVDEQTTQLIEVKDATEDLHKRLCEREDEINSLSLRLFECEQENMELRNLLDVNYNKIERVSIELDNHSH